MNNYLKAKKPSYKKDSTDERFNALIDKLKAKRQAIEQIDVPRVRMDFPDIKDENETENQKSSLDILMQKAKDGMNLGNNGESSSEEEKRLIEFLSGDL